MGGGELGALIRATDWSGTPLGPRDRWPLSLRTTVSLVVESKVPMALLWGPELLLIYNDGYGELAAERHPGALGRPTREVWPEIWHLIEPLLAAVMERGEPVFVEDTLFPLNRHGHLEDAYFDVCYSPMRVEDGTVGGTLAILREKTAALGRSRLLQESVDRLAAMLEQAPFAIALTRVPDGRTASVNEAFLRLFEVAREDAIGKTGAELGIADAASQARLTEELRARGVVRDLALAHTTKAGEQLSLSVNVDRVAIAGQDFVLTTIADVTSHERLEAALRRSEEVLTFALSTAQAGAWELDLADHTIYRSLPHDQIFGYDQLLPEWTYEMFLEHVLPEDRQELDRQVRRAVESKRDWRFEFRIRRRDGETRWVWGAARHRRDERGRDRMVGITQDITERRLAEEALRRSEARQAFLVRLGDAIRPLLDPVRIQDEAMRALGEYLGASRVNYVEVEDDGITSRVQGAFCAPGLASTIGVHRLDAFGADVAQSMTAGRTLVVPDVDEVAGITAQARAAYAALGIAAFVSVPLVKAGRLAAFLAVHQAAPRAWTADEVALVEETAERTWEAVERARAEEALRESERKHRSLFESMDEGFAILELVRDEQGRAIDFRWVMCNPALERLTGIRVEDLVGRRVSELGPPEQNEPWIRTYAEVVDTQTPRRFVHGVASVGRTWDLTAFPYGGDRFAVLYDDITDRLRAEEALRESEARYRDLYDNAPNAFFTVGADGLIQRCNRRAGEMLGYAVEALTGRPMLDLYADTLDGRAKAAAFFERIRAGGTVRSEELEMRRADGSAIWISQSVDPVRDAEGRVIESRSAVADISDRKRLEDERDRRALEAAEERGRAQVAIEADRRKDEFLAMLSHELRNPLAPIRSGLYILDRVAPGSEQARRAQAIIGRQVDHLTRLIEDLLDVTRIVRGKVELKRERLDLSELAQRTAEDHRGAFVDAGIELVVMPSPGEVWVEGDRTRLAQVIGNLLQNAAKFTPRGGSAAVSVDVDGDGGGGKAIVRVQDTGRGIAAEMLPRVFEAFVQVDTTIDRGKGGLGLGLAMVKGLVEMHGGSVSVESGGPGMGSTFTIVLPREAAEVAGAGAGEAARAAEVAGERASAPSRRRTAAGTAAHRVLLIEDNVDAADTLCEALQLGGHEVEIAYNGSEGIRAARAFGPDVVLCDIGLPEMDGYEVARALRADPALGRARLVALTGYAGPESVAKAKEAGFDAHLAKPPSLEALERVLQVGPAERRTVEQGTKA